MAKRTPAPASRGGVIRCAIYTRKSTEEGLEQEFNSLDAQREACAAYITSQRHEGWSQVPAHYDDGGFSGGSMERPGLRQLLTDIRAGKVDVIVVYKVDRLTRSLADFAKIVEVLDAAGASFVSVTQSFNTTTSMGRLTLNVLLSFAQFEREVTGERIRDKVAASKRKGMWMGGVVPLGYDVECRKLIVNERDAATVRHIYARYAELRSIGLLAGELEQVGIRSKQRTLANGDGYGGRVLSKGAVAYLLQNRMYLGDIVHKGESFPGEHQAIVDRELFDRVQGILNDNRRAAQLQGRAEHPSILAGMLVDGEGRRMTPSHTLKSKRRYRYYVTSPGTDGRQPSGGWRIPAGEVERLIRSRVAAWLQDAAAMSQLIVGSGPSDCSAAVREADQLGREIETAGPCRCREILLDLSAQIALSAANITIEICTAQLLALLGTASTDRLANIRLTIEATLSRRGQELRLVLPPRERMDHPQVDA